MAQKNSWKDISSDMPRGHHRQIATALLWACVPCGECHLQSWLGLQSSGSLLVANGR